MNIIYYGHSCFMLETGGKKVLVDPFISPNPLAAHIDIHSISPDYILVSHGHEDHIADLIPIARRSGAQVICSAEISCWLQRKGIENTHGMNIGGKRSFDFGTVKMVNAVHSSSLPDGTYGGTEAGYIIQAYNKTIYYAGDTALHYDMRLLGEFYKLDYAFLPIGDNFTMGMEDAIIAADFIKCNNIIGMHYNTFDLIKIDEHEALKKFKEAGLNLSLIPIGNRIKI